MEAKKMRKILKDKGIPTPRSNKDVIALYSKTFPKKPAEPKHESMNDTPRLNGNVYTYVGSGDEPPNMITFIGIQKFVRGHAVNVTNPTVLEKIKGHGCFVEGALTQEQIDLMFKNDEKAKEHVAKVTEKNAKLQQEVERRNSQE